MEAIRKARSLLAAAVGRFVFVPQVSGQEVLDQFSKPQWQPPKEAIDALRRQKDVRGAVGRQLFTYRVRRKIACLYQAGKLATQTAAHERPQAIRYRQVFWNNVEPYRRQIRTFTTPEAGRVFDVWILDRRYRWQFPGFLAIVGGTILASETIAREERPYYFLHEIYCGQIWKGQPYACLRATQLEVMAVRRDIPEFLSRYLQRRILFFEYLLQDYCLASKPREEIDGLLLSLNWLKREFGNPKGALSP